MPNTKNVRFKKVKVNKQSKKSLALVIGTTFLSSASISYIFNSIVNDLPLVGAMLLLIAIILVGILCDGIGNAVLSASEVPFHSMAAQKVKGAKHSIMLIRNAAMVANIFNDVIGDICGIISGSTAAIIVISIEEGFGIHSAFFAVAMSSFVAAFTVGGKAMGKAFAISRSNYIVYYVGILLYYMDQIFSQVSKKSSK